MHLLCYRAIQVDNFPMAFGLLRPEDDETSPEDMVSTAIDSYSINVLRCDS